MPSKYVIENAAEFTENVTLVTDKVLSSGTSAFSNTEISTEKVKLTNEKVEVWAGDSYIGKTAVVAISSNQIDVGTLSRINVDGLEIGPAGEVTTSIKENSIKFGGATLSAVDTSVDSGNRVAGHASNRHFQIHDGSNPYMVPLLSANKQLPLSVLQGALATGGQLVHRGFINLQWNQTELTWDVSDVATWYANAQATLDPSVTALDALVDNDDGTSGPEGAYPHNYILSGGSYFIVKFQDSSGSAVAPYTIGLNSLFEKLNGKGYLNQNDTGINGSGGFAADTQTVSWWDSKSGTNDLSEAKGWFESFTQGDDYEIHHGDNVLVQRNSHTNWKVDITVMDNTDEFQKRLVSETRVQLPVTHDSPVVDINDQVVTLRGNDFVVTNSASFQITSPDIDIGKDGSKSIVVKATGSGALEAATRSETIIESVNGPVKIQTTAFGGDPADKITVDSGDAMDIKSATNMTMTTTTGDITVESKGTGQTFVKSENDVFVEAKSQAQLYCSGGQSAEAVTVAANSGGVTIYAASGKIIDVGGENGLASVKIQSKASNSGGAIQMVTTNADGPINITSAGTFAVESKSDATVSSFGAVNVTGNGAVSVEAKNAGTLTVKSNSGTAIFESGSSTAILRGPYVELGNANTNTIKVAEESAFTFGSNRYQKMAFKTIATNSLYGLAIEIRVPVTQQACNRLVFLEVNAVGRSQSGVNGQRGFFKGSFALGIDATTADGSTYQYVVSSDTGTYFKSDNLVGYVTKPAGTDGKLWRLALLWNSNIAGVFDPNSSGGGNGSMSVVVSAHTSDADIASGGRLVLAGVDKPNNLPEDGSAVILD